MLYQLPNGLIDGTDFFNYVDLDELRGRQQNYLVDRELVVGNIGHIPKILEDLILSIQTKEGMTWKGQIKDAVWKLPAGDLEFILIKIRENTYGPRFYIEAECPHCEHVNKNLRLDLDTLVIDYMPVEAMMTPKKILLPKMKVEAEVKPLYLKDLFEYIKITTSKKSTLITSLLSVSLKRLGDKDNITSADIEKIPVTDLSFLQEEMDKLKLEGSIDTELDLTCSKCSKDFKSKVNVYDSSFFDPTKGSTTSST